MKYQELLSFLVLCLLAGCLADGNIRKSLLKKDFGKEGNADEFDDEISKIGSNTYDI